MDYAEIREILQSAKDRQDNLVDFILRQGFVTFKTHIQISTLAVLSDYVAVIRTEVYILAFNDIWVTQLRKQTGFASQQSGRNFTLHISHPNLFNCDYAVVLKVGGFVDLAEATFSDFIIHIEDVVFYFFEHLKLLELV